MTSWECHVYKSFGGVSFAHPAETNIFQTGKLVFLRFNLLFFSSFICTLRFISETRFCKFP